VIVGPGNAINDNGGAGVVVGDLSFVTFRAPSNITGNRGGIDVVCQPQFSATRGVGVNIGGGSTNCVDRPFGYPLNLAFTPDAKKRRCKEKQSLHGIVCRAVSSTF
jgi:hypothetical protein